MYKQHLRNWTELGQTQCGTELAVFLWTSAHMFSLFQGEAAGSVELCARGLLLKAPP